MLLWHRQLQLFFCSIEGVIRKGVIKKLENDRKSVRNSVSVSISVNFFFFLRVQFKPPKKCDHNLGNQNVSRSWSSEVFVWIMHVHVSLDEKVSTLRGLFQLVLRWPPLVFWQLWWSAGLTWALPLFPRLLLLELTGTKPSDWVSWRGDFSLTQTVLISDKHFVKLAQFSDC